MRIPVPASMKRFLAVLLLVAAAAVAVGYARRAGSLAAGVPSYRFLGVSRAPLTIVVFSDFQCPSCAAAEPVLKELVGAHDGKIRVAFRHNPLRMHRWAVPAARAAEAAGAQGNFWPYHDRLFQNQKEWSEGTDPAPLFVQYARDLGLDAARFERDFRDARADGLLEADAEAARRANVNATPTFFIGERRLVGAGQLKANGERFVREALE